MKKFLIYIFILVLLILIGIGVYILLDQKQIGDEVDSYKGVSVFYNGIVFTESYGKNYSNDNYYYGQKWQCVEFVKRFYYDAKQHKMPDVYGHAKDFFDSSVAHGEMNASRGLIQYRNGGNIQPVPDDLLIFTDTKYGHVAIVTKVTSNTVEIIQQNIYGKPRDTLPLIVKDGDYTIGNERKPAGWLRKE